MSSLISRASLGLGDVRLPLQCWSVAPQSLFRMLLRTHLSLGLFQGNESSVQMWQSPSKQEGKCSPFFQLPPFISADWLKPSRRAIFAAHSRLFPAWSEIDRSSYDWILRNSPRGETWNKRINYFKTKILSSLGIKLESENEKHRRSLAELRCFTEFSPWQFSLFRFQPCLTLVSLISSERLWEIDRRWGNKTSHSHHNALASLSRTYRQPKGLIVII